MKLQSVQIVEVAYRGPHRGISHSTCISNRCFFYLVTTPLVAGTGSDCGHPAGVPGRTLRVAAASSRLERRHQAGPLGPPTGSGGGTSGVRLPAEPLSGRSIAASPSDPRTVPTTVPRDVRAHAVGAGRGLSSADGRGAWEPRAEGRGLLGLGGSEPLRGSGGALRGCTAAGDLPARSRAAGPPGAAAQSDGPLCGECCPGAWGWGREGLGDSGKGGLSRSTGCAARRPRQGWIRSPDGEGVLGSRGNLLSRGSGVRGWVMPSCGCLCWTGDCLSFRLSLFSTRLSPEP